MPDLEAIIRDAIAKGIEAGLDAALAELRAKQDDDYPDYDEFPIDPPTHREAAVSTAQVTVTVDEPPGPSPLRSLLRGGQHTPLVEDDDDTIAPGTSTGDVVPLAANPDQFRVSSGFDPRANPEWFAANYRRDVLVHLPGRR